MIKKFKNSRIEIWTRQYINDYRIRNHEDEDVIIQQIEPVNCDTYIVEITDAEIEEQEE